MNDISSLVVAIVLVATSVALIVRHVRVWKRLNDEQLEERELDFRRRQFRRRLQTSAMIGILGVAIVVGQLLLDMVKSPKFQVYYWIGVLALLLWIVLLAVADMVATSSYYSRERSDLAVGHAKLQIECARPANEPAAATTASRRGRLGGYPNKRRFRYANPAPQRTAANRSVPGSGTGTAAAMFSWPAGDDAIGAAKNDAVPTVKFERSASPALFITINVPPATVVPPAKLSVPLRTSLPAPNFSRPIPPPASLMLPEKVVVAELLTINSASVPPLLATRPDPESDAMVCVPPPRSASRCSRPQAPSLRARCSRRARADRASTCRR